jgi:hypothetical protein
VNFEPYGAKPLLQPRACADDSRADTAPAGFQRRFAGNRILFFSPFGLFCE